MKLEGTMLIVRDMAVSRRFYQDVLSGAVMLDLGDYVVFEGGYCLLTETHWAGFLERPPHCVYRNHASELSFEDEDIDTFIQKLDNVADIEILTPLKTYPWGQRAVRFSDPEHDCNPIKS